MVNYCGRIVLGVDIVNMCFGLFFPGSRSIFHRIFDNGTQRPQRDNTICAISVCRNVDFRYRRLDVKKRCYDAYFTVEATYIVPMVFLLIVLMIQYGFFCKKTVRKIGCPFREKLKKSPFFGIKILLLSKF